MTKPNFKNGQLKLTWVTIVDAQDDMPGRHFIECAIHNDLRVCFPRTDIIDPADPSLGPWAGWIIRSEVQSSVILDRPTPPWEPEVGKEACLDCGSVVLVLAIDGNECWVSHVKTGRFTIRASKLTAPPSEVR